MVYTPQHNVDICALTGVVPPHGLSTMFIPDGFFRWAFQVCTIPEYHYTWTFHDTWFHVLNF